MVDFTLSRSGNIPKGFEDYECLDCKLNTPRRISELQALQNTKIVFEDNIYIIKGILIPSVADDRLLYETSFIVQPVLESAKLFFLDFGTTPSNELQI